MELSLVCLLVFLIGSEMSATICGRRRRGGGCGGAQRRGSGKQGISTLQKLVSTHVSSSLLLRLGLCSNSKSPNDNEGFGRFSQAESRTESVDSTQLCLSVIVTISCPLSSCVLYLYYSFKWQFSIQGWWLFFILHKWKSLIAWIISILFSWKKKSIGWK